MSGWRHGFVGKRNPNGVPLVVCPLVRLCCQPGYGLGPTSGQWHPRERVLPTIVTPNRPGIAHPPATGGLTSVDKRGSCSERLRLWHTKLYHIGMRDLRLLPIDQITFGDVVAFCALQIKENKRIEYKERFSGKDAGKQIAKTIAAFANTDGGMLILGVDQLEDRLPNLCPKGSDLGNDPVSQINSACAANLHPPIAPEVSDYLHNPNDGMRGALVVRVGASEHIHEVFSVPGVYIRVNDQSEPVQATVAHIEWMLQRREGARTIQVGRRLSKLDCLRAAISPHEKQGNIEVAVGPRVALEPLIDLRGLRDRCNEFCVPSHWANERGVPIDSRMEIRGIADGVYSAYPGGLTFGASAGAMDVFGNLVLLTHLLWKFRKDKFIYQFESDGMRQEDGDVFGVNACWAIERILCMVRAAGNFFAATGFVGSVTLSFRAPLTAGCPLFYSDPGDHLLELLGTGAPGNTVESEWALNSSDLASEPARLLEPLVQQLLWAWGCTNDGASSRVLKGTIRAHLGTS